jgi:alkylation response protein AidB-like acyl-CoA dehydrogenase
MNHLAPRNALAPPADASGIIRRATELGARFAEGAAADDRAARLRAENFADLHAAGLLALSVPAAWGGADAGLGTAVEVVRQIGRGEPATALILSMQLIQHAVLAAGMADGRGWPASVYDRLARGAVADGELINALRVEPALGTPARGGLPATTGRRVAGGFLLSGHKIFSTGIPVLHWLAVWARTDDDQPLVGTFLVPRAASGIRVIETWDHLGLRASASQDVVFEDVFIPEEYAVDVRPPAAWGAGPDPVHQAWNAALLGAMYLGIAEAARDWLAGYLRDRTPANLGAPLASLPRMQAAIGEIAARLRVGRRLLGSLAAEFDGGAVPALIESQVVKQRVTEDAIAAVQQAVALIGNAGLTRSNPLERHLRDVLCGRIHTPQDDSVFAGAGRAALEGGF